VAGSWSLVQLKTHNVISNKAEKFTNFFMLKMLNIKKCELSANVKKRRLNHCHFTLTSIFFTPTRVFFTRKNFNNLIFQLD
jgi:hypothetical protein